MLEGGVTSTNEVDAMLRHTGRILLLLLLTLPTISSIARAKATVKVWATDKVCPCLQVAAEEVAKVPFPDGWTVVVACNDIHWQMLQRKADALATNNAFTNVDGQITVVNGRLFLRKTVGRSPHQVLLHELGHVLCNCGDEAWAERWAVDQERYERKTSALKE